MSNQLPDYQRISADVKLGRDVRIHGFVNLYGCEIGDETQNWHLCRDSKGSESRRPLQDIQPHIYLRGGHD